MDDTPEHIKKLQLEIWMSKTPAQRLRQFMENNDAMYRFWNKMKEAQPGNNSKDDDDKFGNADFQKNDK